ncbi:MAG: PIN domain-containing protein [Halobaculum sp.]
MIVADTNLVSDYLTRHDPAREFLEARESEAWATPSLVVCESVMGAIHGHITGDPADVRTVIRTGFDVLSTSEKTVRTATELQQGLNEGTPLEKTDALIAASAREWDATLATNDNTFWKSAVSERIDVTRYERS